MRNLLTVLMFGVAVCLPPVPAQAEIRDFFGSSVKEAERELRIQKLRVEEANRKTREEQLRRVSYRFSFSDAGPRYKAAAAPKAGQLEGSWRLIGRTRRGEGEFDPDGLWSFGSESTATDPHAWIKVWGKVRFSVRQTAFTARQVVAEMEGVQHLWDDNFAAGDGIVPAKLGDDAVRMRYIVVDKRTTLDSSMGPRWRNTGYDYACRLIDNESLLCAVARTTGVFTGVPEGWEAGAQAEGVVEYQAFARMSDRPFLLGEN